MTFVVVGILLPVVLILMLKLVNDRRIVGQWVNSRRQNAVALGAIIVVSALTVAYLAIAVLSVAKL